MARYSFGPFSLDQEARVLLRDREPIPMAGKTLDTLLVLVQNRGRLVDTVSAIPGTIAAAGFANRPGGQRTLLLDRG
jgi:hypothetical protein